MRGLVIILSLLMASSAAWPEELKLSGVEILAAIGDHTLGGRREDGKGWEQIFQQSGVTFYSVNGAQSQGMWEVRGDQYCSRWPPNEAWACYDVTSDGETVSFISAAGQRSSAKRLN